MNRSQPLDHVEHLDKGLVEELAQVARVTVREELREQTRKQRRTAVLYGASGAAALYAGGAVSVAVGLLLATGLPGWAAALITGALMAAVAYALRAAAHSSGRGPHPPHRVVGGTPPVAPPGGYGTLYPPIPKNPPHTPADRRDRSR
ncbi:phage holin family protein [Streptomyces malaysiense]|uniref:Phage holin family protein n=1 Tax=Streptomyces malaysiense TaxID=1428626 RepID=A0A1J4PVP5_9ACTN|nr:phage holin family protein [Streptomyces malaysiense]OIK24166.1 hypothetical protein VT52_028550 [Streptomyces malaysiense]